MICDTLSYFFARTTLANLWLDQGEIDKAAGLLFVPGRSINTLYPSRKVFRISEIRHWAYLSARTKIMLGEPEIVKGNRDMPEELEPDSPTVRDFNDILDGEKSLIMRMLANLRKLTENAKQRAEQRKECRLTKSLAKPLKKPASEFSSKPASHIDQLELFE